MGLALKNTADVMLHTALLDAGVEEVGEFGHGSLIAIIKFVTNGATEQVWDSCIGKKEVDHTVNQRCSKRC